jgi:hypothetical protein
MVSAARGIVHAKPTFAERSQHVAGSSPVVMLNLAAVCLRIQNVALLVGILKAGNVFLEVVVILGRDRGRGSAITCARSIGCSRHGALESRRNTECLLAKSLGLAHSLTPAHTCGAVVVLVDVDGHLDFNEAGVLFDAQLRRLAAGGLCEGLVGRAVQVLQHIQLLLLLHLGRDVDIVLGYDRVVVFYVGGS